MRVTFWGTRGSVPSPGPSTVRYGGNTPCVEVRPASGELAILDAGTGIRELGHALVEQAAGTGIHGDIFLTHAHWDHIQGIPFFAPLFQRGNRFTLWGFKSPLASIERVVRDQMSAVVFPVTFDAIGAVVDFREVADGESFTRSGCTVAAMAVRHPGGALAYRFTEPGATRPSLVYVSDNELGESEEFVPHRDWRARFVEFARGAQLLVHDSMYTAEEYEHRRGWGHSTGRDGVALAVAAGVDTLALYHHEPRRTDGQIDACTDECRALVASMGASLRVVAAAEGLTLQL